MVWRKTLERSCPVEGRRAYVPASWAIVGFVFVVCALLLGLETSHILSRRADIMASGRKDTANLASSLVQHAELTFRTADAVLLGAVARLDQDHALGPEGRQRLRNWFLQEVRNSSQFTGFAVIGSDGSMVVSSAGDNGPANLSDRDYFIYHRDHDDHELLLSKVVRARNADGWLIPATRRFNRPDGTFGGVVIAAIDPGYFQDLYDRLQLGDNGAVLLASSNGSVLVRRPFVEAYVDRDISQGGLFKLLKQAPVGSGEITAATDGVKRLNSYERGKTYPVVVAVAQDVNELLAPWKQDAIRQFGEVIAIMVFISLLGAVVWRITRTLAANAKTSSETNARFDAALANMSNGLSMFDADGNLMIWNERYVELYGMSPELIRRGVSIHTILAHREDAGNLDSGVEEYVRDFQQELTDFGKSITTSRLKDGRTISVANAAIASGGWVSIHEDSTERIRREEEIAEQAAELGRTNMRFDAALSNMTQGLCLFGADKSLVIANIRFREMYDLPEELVRPGTPLPLILQHHADRGAATGLSVDQHVQAIPTQPNQYFSPADGREIAIKRTPTADGGWVATHEDVTAQRLQEKLLAEKAAELELTNDRFNAALSNMSQGISMYDQGKRLVVWNDRFAEIYRLPRSLLKVGIHLNVVTEDIVARGILSGEADQTAIASKIASVSVLPIDSDRVEELSDGRLILISRQRTSDGGWLATHEDITERRRAEAEINHLARHDALTGLANRAEFNAKLAEASKRLKRYGGSFTVMMLDLDRFKAVNDTLGHPAGDQLLVEVARRLKSSVRETDVLARLGGDEFAIIHEGAPHQHEGAIALALRIINTVTQPFDLDGHQASVGTSIGIVLAPEHGVEPEELLKKADLALYDVKANGRNDFRVFQAEMLEIADSQQSAESELRDALAAEQFELHYQPVIDVTSRRLCGVEALVRWRHPARGLIEPDQFIPLAESTGLVVALGEWVLQRACSDAVSWPADVKLAINISAVQFRKGNLFDVILCTLVETGLAPERLELEITEAALVENQEAHLTAIRQLRNLGIAVVLDDFGTGNSSINYLVSFPFDRVKIDRSFTHGVLNRRDCAAVVASVLALAHGLGIATTAEGVETEAQLEYMRGAGVDLVQGHLFGRAVPIAQLDLDTAGLPGERVHRTMPADPGNFHHRRAP